ncbi:MAG: antibiotic biosynthesis monooxygenase [Candidatus Aminicenantes bacterium]|nr:antibiotic biosynthesis monooxygenase [Candidatus Aminicenantes bacterium]
MYARLTRIHVDTADVDRTVKLYKQYVVPAAKSQKGFLGISLMADKKSGKGISLTFWESEDDALANEANQYYQEQLVKFMSFFKTPPIREGYEILVKEE